MCTFMLIYEEQQMNSPIGWINVFSKGPKGQRQKGARESVKETDRNKAREQKIH